MEPRHSIQTQLGVARPLAETRLICRGRSIAFGRLEGEKHHTHYPAPVQWKTFAPTPFSSSSEMQPSEMQSSKMYIATSFIRLTAFVAFLSSVDNPFARAQSPDNTRLRSPLSRESPSSRETEYQRWIPLDASQGKSQNPLELLARLQKRSKPNHNPFSWSQLQQAFQNNPGLSEQLQNLSPSQREQLKQLAQSFSQQAFPNGPPTSLDDLPPALRQQMESSPELRKLAEELARTQGADGSPTREATPPNRNSQNGDPTGGGTAPELSEAELERAVRDLFENKIESESNGNTDRTAGNSTSPRSSGEKDANADGRGNDSGDGPKTNNGRSARSSSLNVQEGNNPRSNEQLGAPNRAGGQPLEETAMPGNRASNGQSGTEEEQQRAELERIQRRWDEIQRQRALAEQRLQQRQSSSARSGLQSPTDSQSRGMNNSRSENSVDLIQRKLRELGLSSFLQQIAKEAVGVEQRQIDRSQASMAEPEEPNPSARSKSSRSPSRPTQSAPSSNKRSPDEDSGQGDWDRRETSRRWGEEIAATGPRNGSGWFTNSEPSASGARSSNRTKEPEDAPEKAGESPFSLPSFGEFPNLPIWFWVLPLTLGLFVVAVFLLPRSKAILDRISGRASDEARRAEAMLGEIEGREDAVRAFHWILEKKVRGFESWWTSRRVVEHVQHREEPLQPQVAQAAELYDLARYTPETFRLAKSDLERMRQAIRACAAAETIG